MSLEKTPVPELHQSPSTLVGETLTMPVCPSCGLKMAHGTIKCPNDGTEIVTRFKVGDCLSDKYEFIESVGSGGMGIIYKARHLGLNKIVAIKLLHPHLLNAETVMRFQREARTASDLRHPNLITVQDIGTTDDGQPFMVMDYVSGQSLSEFIKEKGRVSVEETLDIFLQICSGLAYAHKQNILHRDLKPSNIMLFRDEDGGIRAKILDFGIAKILEEGDKQTSTLTKTGDVFGSPLYMSPEQGAGGKLDRRSDCYSLGCMLFECLTGTTPFIGKSIIETLMFHAQHQPPSLKEATLGLEFPEALEKVVARLLQKVPEDRYQSVLEVREDLQEIKDERAKNDASVDNVSRRQLRDLASGSGTASGAKQKKPNLANLEGKDIIIALLGIAVIVLLFRDFLPNFNEIAGSPPEPQITKTVQEVDKSKADELAESMSEGQLSLHKQLSRTSDNSQLKLTGCNLKDEDLKSLKGHTEIETLDLETNALDGTGLAVLETLPKLYKLNVSDNPLSDQGVRTISHLDHVKNIELKHIKLSNNAMRSLGQMKYVNKLEFDHSAIGGRSLRFLCSMPNLVALSLNDQPDLSDKSILFLKDIPRLKMIDVSDTPVTGEGFANPERFPQLEIISLKRDKLTELGLKAVGKIEYLKELDLRSAAFDVRWLRHLSAAHHLSKVTISENHDLPAFKKALPNCLIEVKKPKKPGI